MRRFLLIISLILIVTGAGSAQVRPIYNRGAAGLTLLLGRLQTTASALHTGAHPDDEDSALIATLARGEHARVAYLSLNRGEGGQNIIGTELFEALGVIRTEELLQARRLDGGEQFFTRTMDYGFSKTLEEAGTKWGRREVLGDMVRIIRQYRPLVVAARFSGTPADGHGQHQLSGALTPVAFAAAADPAQFPEQLEEGLRPWQAKKLYVGQLFRPDPAAPPTTHIATGRVDPVIGRSYSEVASEGRSQHKSQEMGGIELLGPQRSALRLVNNRADRRRQHDRDQPVRWHRHLGARPAAPWRACRPAPCRQNWRRWTPQPGKPRGPTTRARLPPSSRHWRGASPPRGPLAPRRRD